MLSLALLANPLIKITKRLGHEKLSSAPAAAAAPVVALV